MVAIAVGNRITAVPSCGTLPSPGGARRNEPERVPVARWPT
jgi:hypothetical protein